MSMARSLRAAPREVMRRLRRLLQQLLAVNYFSDLQKIPTLAEALNGKIAPPKINGQKRVHRIGKPDEDLHTSEEATLLTQEHTQLLARAQKTAEARVRAFGRTPQEKPMPTGVYERKARANGAVKPATAEASTKLKRKKPAANGAAKPAKKIVGAATFAVNDTGHLTILDGQQTINLERDDVKRLTAFLERTKALRP